MKHIIIGGDGFVGSHLTADLSAMGEEVLVADIHQSGHAHEFTSEEARAAGKKRHARAAASVDAPRA